MEYATGSLCNIFNRSLPQLFSSLFVNHSPSQLRDRLLLRLLYKQKQRELHLSCFTARRISTTDRSRVCLRFLWLRATLCMLMRRYEHCISMTYLGLYCDAVFFGSLSFELSFRSRPRHNCSHNLQLIKCALFRKLHHRGFPLVNSVLEYLAISTLVEVLPS